MILKWHFNIKIVFKDLKKLQNELNECANVKPKTSHTISLKPQAKTLFHDNLQRPETTFQSNRRHEGSGYILANRLPTTSSNRQSKLWYTPITNTRWVTRKAQCYFLFSQHGTIERHKARGLRSKRRGTS